MRNIYWYIY